MRNRFDLLTTALLFLASAGCSPGVNWRAFNYNAEQVDAARGDKPAFVYFRHWAVVDCTKFEDNVLKLPEVLSATADLYCVVLDYRLDQKLAAQWSVSEPPGVAIVGARGQLLTSGSGYMTRDAVLALIQRGKQEYAGQKGAAPLETGSQ